MVQSLVWQQGAMVVAILGMAAVSRLLSAEAFGVYAATAALFVLAKEVAGFGVQSALIRRRSDQLTTDELGEALGFSAAAAALVFALLLAIALVAGAAGAREFAALLALLALAIPLGPLILLGETRLMREVDFRVIARLTMGRAFANAAVSVGFAWAGFGAFALALGLLAEHVVAAIVFALRGRATGRVRWRRSGWGELLRFGGPYAATTVLPKLADLIRVAMVTAALGPVAMGILNRATTVASLLDRLLLDAVKRLALPIMAVAQRGGAARGAIYLTKLNYLLAVCWPFGAVVIVLAEPIVLTVLGANWQDSVPLVRILAVAAFAYPFTRMSVKLFALFGEERTMLRIQSTQFLLGVALVAAGAMVSLEAVCVAFVASVVIKAVRITVATKRIAPYRSRAALALLARGLVIAVLATVGPGALQFAAPDHAPLLVAAGGLLLASLGWLAGLAVTSHPVLKDALTAWSNRSWLPRKRAAVASQTP